ncbi:MAG: hypothetical protein QNL05_07510 [Gammaproteobacteria bacterium]|nr:hypothetical protein [Gammaproteobacteria bacterium]MDX2487421.1 hypothetical protein [Gammaproteobacteria bacterium]
MPGLSLICAKSVLAIANTGIIYNVDAEQSQAEVVGEVNVNTVTLSGNG